MRGCVCVYECVFVYLCVCVCVFARPRPFQLLNQLPNFHKTRYEHDANEGHHNAGIFNFPKLLTAEGESASL